MKIRVIGQNQTEVTNGNMSILFSYNTPVAYVNHQLGKFFKTSKKWSKTTSKHINQWLDGSDASEISQEQLEKEVA